MLGEDNPHNNGATPDDHPGHPDNDGWSSSEGGRNAWRTVRSLGSGDNSRHRHQRRRAVEERAPSAFIAAGADVESSARRDKLVSEVGYSGLLADENETSLRASLNDRSDRRLESERLGNVFVSGGDAVPSFMPCDNSLLNTWQEADVMHRRRLSSHANSNQQQSAATYAEAAVATDSFREAHLNGLDALCYAVSQHNRPRVYTSGEAVRETVCDVLDAGEVYHTSDVVYPSVPQTMRQVPPSYTFSGYERLIPSERRFHSMPRSVVAAGGENASRCEGTGRPLTRLVRAPDQDRTHSNQYGMQPHFVADSNTENVGLGAYKMHTTPNIGDCYPSRPMLFNTFAVDTSPSPTGVDVVNASSHPSLSRMLQMPLPKKDVMKPQQYDGREPINSFLAHFEVCARFNRWNENERCCWLQWSLKGRAQQVLWDLPSSQLLSYDSIVRALRERYGSEHQCEVYRIELRNRRRGPKESLSDVMQDIRRLMVLAYTATSSDMWESIAINSYLEALNDPQLALEIRKRGPTTLEMAYRDSLLLEGFMRASQSSRTDAEHQNRKREQARATTSVSSKSDEANHAETQAWHKEVIRMQKDLQQQFLKQVEHQERENQKLFELFSSIVASDNGRKTSISQQSSNYHVQGGQASSKRIGSGQGRTTGGCFNCGEKGHFARKCPLKEGTIEPTLSITETNLQPIETRSATTVPQESRHIVGSRTAYLPVTVDGKSTYCVLDTGSGISVIPERLVSDYTKIRSTDQKLYAANGTEIEIMGEATIELRLDDLTFDAECIVSEFVDELLLGLDFMETHEMQWDFSRRVVKLCGRQLVLYSHDPCSSIRRIVVQQDTTIPPRSCVNVKARTVYSDLKHSLCQWSTQSKEIKPGVHIARTVVKDQPNDVVVQVMNTNESAIELDKGAPLSSLDAVQVVVADPESDEGGAHLVIDELMNSIDPTVTEKEKEELKTLLVKYSDVFSKNEYDLGRTAKVQHRIDTGDSKPVRQALRRQPLAMLRAIDEQLETMQKQSIIEPCQSEWASNIVVVRKKDGSLRFCVDYRQLNDRTIKDAYPLPKIEECLDVLSGSSWFTSVDLRSGYHQVAMHPDDIHKTAFITRRGSFAFKVMPFGLCNAPATFQRLMDVTMAGINYDICLVYLDDILVYSQDISTHLERLEALFNRLRYANLKIKPSKCQLLKRSVDFLGYVISSKGIQTDFKKIEAIRDWPEPKSLKEVRSFVGLCGYYRRFVRGFSEIAAPLHALTKKNVKFVWTSSCQQAFNTLKNCLISAPVLAMPNDEGQYILDTDASNSSIGAILSQMQDGEERVIAYASRLYSDAEKNYCVTRKELLAVVFYVKHFKQYLLGRSFLVRTDHSALQWLRHTPEPIGQQARWLEILEEFTFAVQHRPGRLHINADALSRIPCRQCGAGNVDPGGVQCRKTTTVRNVHKCDVDWNHESLQKHQSEDPELRYVYHAFKEHPQHAPSTHEIESESKETKAYCAMWPFLEMHDCILYRRRPADVGRETSLQLLAPLSYRHEIMYQAHAGFTGGHLGHKRTFAQVRRRSYWLGYASDVYKFCRQCNACNQYWRGKAPKQGLLQPMTTGEPFERIGVDITGPHPKSSSGYIYILTLVDYFSKWCDAFPMRNQEASSIASILVDRVFSYFGTPLQLLTDRGRNFESELFEEMCKLMKIDHIRTTTYKPSTNGLVERFHRTLNSMIAKVVAENQRNWDKCLPSVLAAYRATVHESTGFTPNYLFLGRENYAPLDLVMPTPHNELPKTANEFVSERGNRMQKAYDLVRSQLGKCAMRRKRYYDMRVRDATFKSGDWVWLFHPRRFARISPKWQRMYTGPYLVLHQIGPVNYRVQKSRRSKPVVVHVDKLKLCTGPTPVSWLTNAEQCDDVFEPHNANTDNDSETDEQTYTVLDCGTEGFNNRPQRQRRLPARYLQRIYFSKSQKPKLNDHWNCAFIDTVELFVDGDMEAEKFVCKTCGVVKPSFTALHNHLRRSHRVKKPDAAVVSSSTSNESDIMLVPMVTTQVAACKEPVQPPPTSLSSVPTATSACFESVTNEKLATRQIISRTIKTLASWQQVDRRTLELSTSILEERLYRELNLTELPPSAITAIVMTARYFLDLGQHSRVKPRSAEIQSIDDAAQKLSDVNLKATSTKVASDADKTDCQLTADNVEMPAALITLHQPGEEDQCTLCIPRIVEPVSLTGQIVRRTRKEVANASDAVAIDVSTVQANVREVDSPPNNDDEETWRNDIWRSYVTREVQFPSSSDGNSTSSDDFPWGDDSPDELLEPGCYGLKWHPYFLDNNDQQLAKGSDEWQQRMRQWQSNRTPIMRRDKEKRRHCHRARRSSQERYKAAISSQLQVTMDWERGCYRPLERSDITMPRRPRCRRKPKDAPVCRRPTRLQRSKSRCSSIVANKRQKKSIKHSPKLRSVVVVPVNHHEEDFSDPEVQLYLE
jgi:transposase InsO family protein